MTSWYASRSLFRICRANWNETFAFSIATKACALSTPLLDATATAASRASSCKSFTADTARVSVSLNASPPRGSSALGDSEGAAGTAMGVMPLMDAMRSAQQLEELGAHRLRRLERGRVRLVRARARHHVEHFAQRVDVR